MNNYDGELCGCNWKMMRRRDDELYLKMALKMFYVQVFFVDANEIISKYILLTMNNDNYICIFINK